MNKLLTPILFAFLLLAVISCRLVQTLTSDDPNLKKVGDLWSDVPRMDGLVSAETEMPVYVKVLLRTSLNNLGRFNNANEDRTKANGDWVVFTIAQSPQEVQKFYTNERMTSFGDWEASKNSTCLNGSQYGFSGVGCVFKKTVNKRDIGLLIVAAQDEQKKRANVFFVRVETEEPPVGRQPPAATPKATRGEIRPLNGTAPYGIEKRPLPTGLDLETLLPKQVGPYSRTLLEQSNQRGVAPAAIEADGPSVYATYVASGKEIFFEFAVSSSADNAQTALDVAATEVTDKFPADPRFGSFGTEPSYLRVDNESGAFFAWTRGRYYFSASAKGGQADLDAFMQAFPH